MDALVITKKSTSDVDFVVTESDREEIYNFLEKNPEVTAIKLFKNVSAYGKWIYVNDYVATDATADIYLGDFIEDFDFKRFGECELIADDDAYILRSGVVLVIMDINLEMEDKVVIGKYGDYSVFVQDEEVVLENETTMKGIALPDSPESRNKLKFVAKEYARIGV